MKEKQNQLMKAVEENRIADLKTILADLSQEEICLVLNVQDELGWSPLHHAALVQNVKMVKRLIKLGANVDLVDANNKKFFDYLKGSAIEAVRKVYNRKYPDREPMPNPVRDDNSWMQNSFADSVVLSYTLEDAVSGKDIDTINILVRTAGEEDLQSALCQAVQDGYADGVGAILTDSLLGVLDEKTKRDVLKIAFDKGYEDVLIKLVEKIDVNNYRFGLLSETLLMSAVKKKNMSLISTLLEKWRVDVNAVDSLQNTALTIASKDGTPQIVTLLVQTGANINYKDMSGKTPLMIAAEEGNLEIVNALIELRADVNIQNNDGETALKLAKSRAIRDSLRNAGAIDFPHASPTVRGNGGYFAHHSHHHNPHNPNPHHGNIGPGRVLDFSGF